MLTDTSSRATKSPKRLVTPRTSMLMAGLPAGRCAALVGSGLDGSWVVWSLLGPPQERHDHDAEDRGGGQQERYGVGGGLLEVLVLLLDDQRGGLRLAHPFARA